MPSDYQTVLVSAEALARKHEAQNPPLRGILLAVLVVVAMTAGCILVVQIAFTAFAKGRPTARNVQALGIIQATGPQMLERFPPPHLQMNPRDDLLALRAHEAKQLSSYGWLDRTNGVVRIPVERAMELILQRGLPTRGSNTPAKTGASSLELIQQRSAKR